MNKSEMYAFMCSELTNGGVDIEYGPTAGCTLAPEALLPEGDWAHVPSEVTRPDGSIEYVYCPLADCPDGLPADGVLIRDDVLYVSGSSWVMFHFRFRRA